MRSTTGQAHPDTAPFPAGTACDGCFGRRPYLKQDRQSQEEHALQRGDLAQVARRLQRGSTTKMSPHCFRSPSPSRTHSPNASIGQEAHGYADRLCCSAGGRRHKPETRADRSGSERLSTRGAQADTNRGRNQGLDHSRHSVSVAVVQRMRPLCRNSSSLQADACLQRSREFSRFE